jgi:hypothetical protein
LTPNVTPLNNALTNSNFTKFIVRLEDYNHIHHIYVKFYKNVKLFSMLLRLVAINGLCVFTEYR